MTCTVTIKNDCNPKEAKVRVVIMDADKETEEFFLENGERASRHAYSDRKIIISEVQK